MNKAKFEKEYKRLTDYLDKCRQDAIEEKRKNDPDVIKANSEYSLAITMLDANWATVRRGQYDQEAYIEQRQKILDNRDKAENDAVREGFIQIKDEALDNFFAGEPDSRQEARNRVDTSPKYQWLKEKDQHTQVAQEQGKTIQEKFTQRVGNQIPPVQQQFQAQRVEVTEKDNEQEKRDLHAQKGEITEKVTNMDKFPGYGAPLSTVEAPKGEREIIETTLDFDASDYPGYDSTYPSEMSSPPPKGITYTPPKDGPTME